MPNFTLIDERWTWALHKYLKIGQSGVFLVPQAGNYAQVLVKFGVEEDFCNMSICSTLLGRLACGQHWLPVGCLYSSLSSTSVFMTKSRMWFLLWVAKIHNSRVDWGERGEKRQKLIVECLLTILLLMRTGVAQPVISGLPVTDSLDFGFPPCSWSRQNLVMWQAVKQLSLLIVLAG